MKRKPPAPPKKPTPPKKKTKPATKTTSKKVVSITTAKRKAAAKKKAAGGKRIGKKRPPLLVLQDFGNGRVGPKLFTKGDPYNETLPDPEAVLAEQQKSDGWPTQRLRRAVSRMIRMGALVRESLAHYGVTENAWKRWLVQAQLDFEAGVKSSPCLDFVRIMEIAEAQGEVITTLDARLNPDNTLPFLKRRYARNWDDKIAGAAPLTLIQEPEVVEQVADEDGAYILSVLENARGGRKQEGEEETASPAS